MSHFYGGKQYGRTQHPKTERIAGYGPAGQSSNGTNGNTSLIHKLLFYDLRFLSMDSGVIGMTDQIRNQYVQAFTRRLGHNRRLIVKLPGKAQA